MAAFGTALRRLIPLVLAAIAVLIIYVLLERLAAAMDDPGFRLASWLTMKLRKPVKPATVQGIFHAFFWVVRWIVAPLLLLPIAPAIVSRGRRRRTWLYCLEAPVLLLIAVWVPLKLVAWVPHMKTFNGEMTSFVLRAAAAFLLFVSGWLVLAFVTAQAKSRNAIVRGRR
jgi:hypothetical protein